MKPATSKGWLLGALIAVITTLPAAAKPPVKHPNLLLNREEIEEVKKKIKTQPSGSELFDNVKAMADSKSRIVPDNPRVAALAYALTGDKRYADTVRRDLVNNSRRLQAEYDKVDLKLYPETGAWSPYSTWAWA